MINQNSNSNNKVVTNNEPPHHVRTLFAALFGVVALVLVLFSILAVWLNQTLTNTQLFVDTMSPLASQPDVQNFIAEKAAGQIVDSAPTADLAQQFLPAGSTVGKTDADVQAVVKPVMRQSFI